MKLEDQVCSLELAKKLNELGVLQNGAFDYYENTFHPDRPFIVLRPTVNLMENPTSWICSAFTVAELGEMLPTLGISWVKSNNGRGRDYWWGRSSYPTLGEDQIESADYSEADARAKMLIKMIERGLVKP